MTESVEKLDPRYIEALRFAAQLHDGQMRKVSQCHYLSHLLSVSALVMENGGSDDESIAALLHDSIEDQGDKYQSVFQAQPRSGRDALKRDIKLLFGPDVLDIVIGCTDDEDHVSGVQIVKDGSVRSWRKRKTQYLESLRLSDDPKKIRVSVADKLHNGRCILLDFQEEGLDFWDQFTAGPVDQVWYYDQLAEIFTAKATSFGDDGIRRLAEELNIVVTTFKNLLPSPSEHCVIIINRLAERGVSAETFGEVFPQMHHFFDGDGDSRLSTFLSHCQAHQIRGENNFNVYRRLFHVQRCVNKFKAAAVSSAEFQTFASEALGEYPLG